MLEKTHGSRSSNSTQKFSGNIIIPPTEKGQAPIDTNCYYKVDWVCMHHEFAHDKNDMAIPLLNNTDTYIFFRSMNDGSHICVGHGENFSEAKRNIQWEYCMDIDDNNNHARIYCKNNNVRGFFWFQSTHNVGHHVKFKFQLNDPETASGTAKGTMAP